MNVSVTYRTIDAVWRIESPRLIASLVRMVRDVGIAEDVAQDALIVAMEQWPQSGIPENPGAWLMTCARHRAIDLLRRNKLLERKVEELGRVTNVTQEPDFHATVDVEVSDDLLPLIFMTCHPVLSRETSVALTLRLEDLRLRKSHGHFSSQCQPSPSESSELSGHWQQLMFPSKFLRELNSRLGCHRCSR